ncbi:ER-golgi trafficking TRAPP I complex 85 kDa subunit-domain-containing protein [Flammula alnicola]|nr:ER-golgi trafficking TRAPP I complex 85 kDa subunit-domain-containing protein [Flammula alnicola]
MAPTLPSSLSPHICILTSPDLSELLEKASLPPLPHILQSFSPLPQVTTRTATLVSIPHASFALRFSDLQDVEEACREDEEQRAIRSIDWMSARISKRCGKWVQDVDILGDKEGLRTPWWDELRRCVEGDFVPAKTEGWNHPVALILAVSTTAPNPLQAITALHSRSVHFPPWVDSNFLRYTLIIHPQHSPLSDEEAGALFNAVKKQFGLHSYLLPLGLPRTPPPPVPVPALLPRLPPPPSPDSPPQQDQSAPTSPHTPGSPTILNTLRMEERDIQQTARFTREFVVMSLVPWMEKCVIEWNENVRRFTGMPYFSSTRRLPSRLFSSTRRLFGSQPPTPAPTPPMSSSSSSSLPGRSTSVSLNGGPAPPSQQRRLAEFSTILGDSKLAVTVWEALRKDSKGGSDILPLLLSPSPAIPLHAQTSLTSIHPHMSDLPPHAQIRALLCAVRWEAGISTQDFLSNTLEGERWLVWAASNAEEAPSALLLAQAALLSTKKKARRRAALWYVLASNRLEKCGIKPLTMYFLRKAQELYTVRPSKELSPSFWDSEGKSPMVAEGQEEIMSGIEHPLGRLLYTTGEVAGAVRLFLSLLRGASAFSNSGLPMLGDGTPKVPGNDKLYLDDFRVAYNYWKSTDPDQASGANLQIPLKLCVSKQSRLRFPGDNINGDTDVWSSRQEDWTAFWRAQGGKTSIAPSGKLFWIDLIMQNPLDAEINLSNVTLIVQETQLSGSDSIDDFVEIEVIKEVTLAPKASSLVPISLKSKRPAKLSITHAKYDFLSQLPITESLASRGRQQPTYAPDVVIKVEVVPSDHRLLISYIEDERLVLLQGENKTRPITEIWMVSGADDEIWVGAEDISEDSKALTEIVRSQNSLKPQEPRRLSLKGSEHSSGLQPGEGIEVSAILHAESTGNHELSFLFVFREDDSQPFYSTKLARSYEVQPLFEISVSAEPSQLENHAYILDVDMTNVSQTTSVDITQITSLSPQGTMAPSQCSRFLLGVSPWSEGSGSRETLEYVSEKLSNLLKGVEIGPSAPPDIDLHCSHISKAPKRKSMQGAAIMNFIQSGRRKYVSRNIARVHPYITPTSHPAIFPLYNPAAVDLIVFWEIPSRNISGHLNVHGITLGAGHAALEGILEEAESAKVKRSMYAETRRENMEVLDAIRGSEWNVEMNPVVLSTRDIGTKLHDFTTGPCHIPLEFRLRNHSLTLPAQYTLRLQSKRNDSTNLLPPPYLGRLTFRGTIPPSETTTIHPKLWVTRPGAYDLGGWTLETEVSIPSRGTGQSVRKRRYLQEPPAGEEAACVIVCDSQAS